MHRAHSSVSSFNPKDDSGPAQSKSIPEVELSLIKTPSKQEEDDNQPLKHQSSQRREWNGAHNSIALAIAIVTVPLIVIVVLLFYLVFHFQVQRREPYSPLQLPTDVDDTSAYFVDYSATKLTTLASWASNVATVLPASLMTLLSYRLAKTYSGQSQKARDNIAHSPDLPTPYQLGLILEMLDGKLMALWRVSSQCLGKRKSRVNGLVRSAYSLLTVALILNYLIWTADTWFHVSITTVPFSEISSSSSPPNTFGSQIRPECVGWFNTTTIDGDLMGLCRDQYMRTMDADAFQLANNVSKTHKILNGFQDHSRFSFLAPADPPPGLDFRTTTYAIRNTCQPISKKCNLTNNGSEAYSFFWDYNCSPNFRPSNSSSIYLPFGSDAISVMGYPDGCVVNPGGCVAFFANSSLLDIIGLVNWTVPAGTPRTDRNTNPFYAGILGQVSSQATPVSSNQFPNDSQIMYGGGAGAGFILGCDVMVYNLTYSWVNGSVTSVDLVPSNDDITQLIREGFQDYAVTGGVVASQLSYSTLLLAYIQSNSSQQLADLFAPQLEMSMLAVSANVWESVPNIEEQFRRNILVARVPKAPLFTLVLLCLFFVALGLLLFITAMKSQSTETRNVQARLNVFGIIASRFESPDKASAPVNKVEDMFEDSSGRSPSTRVEMVKSDNGGWAYSSSLEKEGPGKVGMRRGDD